MFSLWKRLHCQMLPKKQQRECGHYRRQSEGWAYAYKTHMSRPQTSRARHTTNLKVMVSIGGY